MPRAKGPGAGTDLLGAEVRLEASRSLPTALLWGSNLTMCCWMRKMHKPVVPTKQISIPILSVRS